MMLTRKLSVVAVILILATPAHAWCRKRARCGPCGVPPGAAMAMQPMPACPAGYPQPMAYGHAAPQAADRPAGGDAGFVAWLNGVRSSYGLPAVAWDANLAAWAAENSRYGMGHLVRCGRRQNAGYGDIATVCGMWLQSPAHFAALVDPSVTRVGIACVNGVWTYNGD